MENTYLVVTSRKCDPKDLKTDMSIVSFKIECLDKYWSNPDRYDLPKIGDVGVIYDKEKKWDLQVDIHEKYFNTFLYKLQFIPDEEQLYLIKYNISPKELSETAYNRWCQGKAI